MGKLHGSDSCAKGAGHIRAASAGPVWRAAMTGRPEPAGCPQAPGSEWVLR